MAAAKSKGEAKTALDISTVAGVLVALGAVVGGLLLEHGAISDIAQLSAAITVLGGTAGAVMISAPFGTLAGALVGLRKLLFEPRESAAEVTDRIVDFAIRARKNGIVSLETDIANIPNVFLRKALGLAVDGSDLQELRHMMELEIEINRQRQLAEAKIFEAAGGFAPTVGILGAVMGLIQVMKNLANIDEVGRGIAVAFVATVYGVGAANLLFLPAGAKLKARVAKQCQNEELMLQGVIGIVEGLNPKLLRVKLEAYQMVSGGAKKAEREPDGLPVAERV